MAVLDTYALTDLASAKEHLEIPNAETSEDDIITRYINVASNLVEEHIDRKVLKRSYDDYRSGTRNKILLLREWPAVKPTELWIDPSSEFTNTQYQLPLDQYEIMNDMELVLTQGRMFGRGNRNIKIVYEAGYDTTPYVLENSCLWLVQWNYDHRKNRNLAQQSKGKNSESVSYTTRWPEWLVEQLDKYKRVEFAMGEAALDNY